MKSQFENYISTLDHNTIIEKICSDDNFLSEMLLVEKSVARKIISYPGTFQPFHRGHYEIYEKLIQTFGQDSVYIVTQGLVNSEFAPLQFEEQKEMISKMYGIPIDAIVQAQNPYKPIELLSKFDSQKTVLVDAISQREIKYFEHSDYFKEYFSAKEHQPYVYEGYFFIYDDSDVVDLDGHKITAKRIRDVLRDTTKTDKEKKKFFVNAFGSTDKNMYGRLMMKLNSKDINPNIDISMISAKSKKKNSKAKTKVQDPEDIKDILRNFMHDRIENPITDNDIYVISALGYGKGHPAYRLAKKYLKQRLLQHQKGLK